MTKYYVYEIAPLWYIYHTDEGVLWDYVNNIIEEDNPKIFKISEGDFNKLKSKAEFCEELELQDEKDDLYLCETDLEAVSENVSSDVSYMITALEDVEGLLKYFKGSEKLRKEIKKFLVKRYPNEEYTPSQDYDTFDIIIEKLKLRKYARLCLRNSK
jgi:hypothetical protein